MLTSAPNIVALNVFADNGDSHLLPNAQFLSATRFSNPALEQDPNAPPEKMLINFAKAEVVVLSSGLAAVESDLQQYGLKFVKSAPRRFVGLLNTHIANVTITFPKKGHEH